MARHPRHPTFHLLDCSLLPFLFSSQDIIEWIKLLTESGADGGWRDKEKGGMDAKRVETDSKKEKKRRVSRNDI